MSDVLNKFVERLTDAFNKTTDGNIYNLFKLTAYHIQENEDLLDQIGDWRDIDQAEGETLNRIGRNVQQNRGQATDSIYRVLIKSKIKRNLSDGSINTLIDFLAFILGVEKSKVKISELWPSGEHAELHVDVPIAPVSATGLTLNQFGTLVNLVVAAGVKANVLFQGSFEFSSIADETETDETKGFAPLDQSTGGEFGASYDPGEDYELPI